jgi:proline iminopeptidase
VGDERSVTTSDGIPLWTLVEGSGPPLLLVHGGPGLWDHLGDLASLLRTDFTVHRWDQRGCGRSGPAPGYDLEVARRDVRELRAAWGVDRRWALVGHSWGAYLALLTATRHSESTAALVYVSGTGTPTWWREVGSTTYARERAARTSPSARARRCELAGRVRRPAEEAEFRRLSWITDFAVRSSPPAALEEMASCSLPIAWEVNRRLAGAEPVGEAAFLASLERCHVPALFLHGSEDPRPDEGARLLTERLPDARFLRIEGAGHLPWVERPHQVGDAIKTFLRDVM